MPVYSSAIMSDPESKAASAQVRRINIIGLAANIILALFRFAGGMLGASQAVVADAVHTLTDSLTDIALLVTDVIVPLEPQEKNR